ncbi:hypothetical protein BAE44_0009976, partial [Dichanthelium oligosanthes]
LESLETLDIRGAKSVILLPVSFGKLGKLVRLLAGRLGKLLAGSVELPDGVALENMKSLQELVGICPTLHALTEIGKLRGLKVLGLVIEENPESGNLDTLIPTCLQICPSLLQVLVLSVPFPYSLDFLAQVPSSLQTFICNGIFRAFPRWINSSLSCLTVLSIVLYGVCVQHEHLDKLAQLRSLRFLRLHTMYPPDEQEMLVIHSSASAFPCLTNLRIWCWNGLMFLKFQHGAMRKLERLCLSFNPREPNKHFGTNNFDYGLQNLPSLRHVVIELDAECPEAQDAIRKTINDHPNRPSLDFTI